MAGKTHWVNLANEAKIHLLQVIASTCWDETVIALCHYHSEDIKKAFKFLEKEGVLRPEDPDHRDPYYYLITDEWKKYAWYHK